VQVAAEPVEVLGTTARRRQVLQPHRGIIDTRDTVENLSMVGERGWGGGGGRGLFRMGAAVLTIRKGGGYCI
jgi:hypothetical protein